MDGTLGTESGVGKRDGDGRGRFERLLFSFMGPPQVGDLNAPARELPERPVDMCRTCGQPRDDHEVVRAPSLTYTRCPSRT